MRSISVGLVCLALLFSLSPLCGLCQQNEKGAPSAYQAEDSCLKETTIKVANREQIITLQDAEQIKLAVENYLAAEKPKLEPSVSGPGKVFIDCQGTVRMGEWILESSFSGRPELRLTFRILTSAHFIVRQEINLRQAEGQWKVLGSSCVTYHLRRK